VTSSPLGASITRVFMMFFSSVIGALDTSMPGLQVAARGTPARQHRCE
jgi:hypothetical protein